jgi:ribA/ribD-fused uncharacterized protein
VHTDDDVTDSNNNNIKEHCGEVEHDDDFCYDCSELVVFEEGDEKTPEGRIDFTSVNVVTFYNTPTAAFSPFHTGAPFVVDGKSFPTVEHFTFCRQFSGGAGEGSAAAAPAPSTTAAAAPWEAILASPVQNLSMLSATLTSSEAPRWDKEARFAALKEGYAAKFEQHPDLQAELKATARKTLVLVDADTFWGMSAAGGIPTGRNRTGACLMEVRGTFA